MKKVSLTLTTSIFASCLVISCNDSSSKKASSLREKISEKRENDPSGRIFGPAECDFTISRHLPDLVGNTPISQLQKNHHSPVQITGGDDVEETLNCQSPTPGAREAADLHTVAVVIGDSQCTGVVVADNMILTAAHCFGRASQTDLSPGYIVLGNQLKSPLATLPISCWQAHGYEGETLNDIAWVRVKGSLKQYGYAPVQILSDPTTISKTEEKLFAGFGLLNERAYNKENSKRCVSTSGSPHYTGDYVVPELIETFNKYYGIQTYEKYLTVIGPIPGLNPSKDSEDSSADSAKGTCNGDSGGPTYIYRNGEWVLAALVQGSSSLLTPQPIDMNTNPITFDYSQVAHCSEGYGIYTTIGNYKDWIENTSGTKLSMY